jgi:hypothetical protein
MKATGQAGDGRPMLLLSLSGENVTRLMANERIRLDLRPLGPARHAAPARGWPPPSRASWCGCGRPGCCPGYSPGAESMTTGTAEPMALVVATVRVSADRVSARR